MMILDLPDGYVTHITKWKLLGNLATVDEFNTAVRLMAKALLMKA